MYLRQQYRVLFELFEESLIIISAEVGVSKKDKDLDIYKLAINKVGQILKKYYLLTTLKITLTTLTVSG